MDITQVYHLRNELSTHNNCIYKGNRADVLEAQQSKSIELAHEDHCGIVKTQERCRECVWWAGNDKKIECYISKCVACRIFIQEKGVMFLPLLPKSLFFPFHKVADL